MADHPDIRIGDRERLAAQDHLREAYGSGALDLEEFEDRLAVAMVARTNGELQPLLADLPDAPTGEVTLAKDPVPTVPPPPRPASSNSIPWGWIIAGLVVLSAIGVGGFGLGGQGIGTVTIFGSNDVDVFPGDDEQGMLTLFGSTTVIVHDDAPVRSSMTSIFGSSECQTACTASGSDPSTVTVSGLTMFGSVEFLTPEEAERDG